MSIICSCYCLQDKSLHMLVGNPSRDDLFLRSIASITEPAVYPWFEPWTTGIPFTYVSVYSRYLFFFISKTHHWYLGILCVQHCCFLRIKLEIIHHISPVWSSNQFFARCGWQVKQMLGNFTASIFYCIAFSLFLRGLKLYYFAPDAEELNNFYIEALDVPEEVKAQAIPVFNFAYLKWYSLKSWTL